MNYKKLIVIIGLVGSLSMRAERVEQAVAVIPKRCDEQRINKHEQQLKNRYARNKALRFGLEGSGLAAIAVACIMIWRDFSIISGDDLRSVQVELATLAAKVAHVEGGEIKIKRIGGTWGAFLGRLVAHMFVSSSLSYIAQKFFAPIFQDHTIMGFVQDRTTLALLEKELQALRADIGHLSVSSDMLIAGANLDRYETVILDLYTDIITQVELIVGYMRVRLKRSEHIAVEDQINAHTKQAGNILEQVHVLFSSHRQARERIANLIEMVQGLEQFVLQIKRVVTQSELLEKK